MKTEIKTIVEIEKIEEEHTKVIGLYKEDSEIYTIRILEFDKRMGELTDVSYIELSKEDLKEIGLKILKEILENK